MSSDSPDSPPSLLGPIPINDLHWTLLSDSLDERTVRRILRNLGTSEFESLRHQVWVVATTIRHDLQIPITDAELSQLFGRKGGWAQGMMRRHLQQKSAESPTSRGRPRLVESPLEQSLVQFCLRRQAERRPAAVQDVIDFMNEHDQQVDRYWVSRFVERSADTLAMRQSTFLEADRHNVTPGDITRYFRELEPHLRDIPSMFVWNADETRVGAPKKEEAPHVIVSAATRPGPITVPQIRGDAQLTLLKAISAFGGATPPLFISKNESFEARLLAAQQLYEPYDFTIRTAAKTFMTEVLFIDWLQTTFIPWNDNFRRKMDYDGLILLLVDGHATHITPRVIAFAVSRKIFIFQLVPHSSHISQPCDLCVFGLFKILYKKEKKLKGMRGETLKIYRAMQAFYKATIVPMVRWSFVRAGFVLNSERIDRPLTVNPQKVIARLNVPELTFEQLVGSEAIDPETLSGARGRKRRQIPAPTTFAVSLAAYAKKVGGKCPLCEHPEDEEEATDEDDWTD